MKDRILDTASRLFVKKGYYQTSMDDVAREAGIAKGSLYYHFKNKSQLFCETVIGGIKYFEEQTDRIVSGSDAPQRIAGNIVALLIDIYTDNEHIADIVMSAMNSASSLTTAGIDEDAAVEIREAKNHFTAKIASVIDEGIADGSVRSCSSMITAYAMISYIYTYCSLLRKKGQFDKKAVTEQITQMLMRGLLK